MARPSPKIVNTIQADDGTTWDIMQTNSVYTITYQGLPCGVRQHIHTLTTVDLSIKNSVILV